LKNGTNGDMVGKLVIGENHGKKFGKKFCCD
jgi:hypothetical protein